MLTVKIKGTIGTFDLDAEVDAGTGITGLYGVSGAGKSTILRAIAGLWRPDGGIIRIGDRVLFDSAEDIDVPTHKRRLGVVFQAPLLFPHLSVADNLRYGMKRNSEMWDHVITMLDMENLLTRMPRRLSGGEAQRVALGRALLADPQVLLLDEPLTGLDDARRAQVLPYLEKLRDETSVPIVYVSHNREEIMRLADLVFLVENGSVAQEMTPGEFEKFTLQPPITRQDMV